MYCMARERQPSLQHGRQPQQVSKSGSYFKLDKNKQKKKDLSYTLQFHIFNQGIYIAMVIET